MSSWQCQQCHGGKAAKPGNRQDMQGKCRESRWEGFSFAWLGFVSSSGCFFACAGSGRKPRAPTPWVSTLAVGGMVGGRPGQKRAAPPPTPHKLILFRISHLTRRRSYHVGVLGMSPVRSMPGRSRRAKRDGFGSTSSRTVRNDEFVDCPARFAPERLVCKIPSDLCSSGSLCA